MGLQLPAAAWGETADRLAERFTVIAADNPGAGATPVHRGRLTTARLADALVGVLDEAEVEAASVYGVSLGGMIAQELALRHRERVLALVLGCTWPGGGPAVLPTRAVIRRLVGTTPPSGESLLVSPAWVEARRAAGLPVEPVPAEGMAPPRAALRQFVAAVTHDATARLAEIEVPTLVLHGGADRIVPVANAELLAAAIPGAELRTYEGVGHAYPVEVGERAFADVVEFLERRRVIAPGGRRAGGRPAGGRDQVRTFTTRLRMLLREERGGRATADQPSGRSSSA